MGKQALPLEEKFDEEDVESLEWIISMKPLNIPPKLAQEFKTVEILWGSDAETRRVDSLILSWVKYEKQLRRLFCFLVFQHPQLRDEKKIEEIIQILVENKHVYPETFIEAIKALGATPIEALLGGDFPRLWKGIVRIRKYRNKLMHGQNTGQSIKSPQIELDVRLIIEWIARVADSAYVVYGYDGLERNTKHVARKGGKLRLEQYPFSTPHEFKGWLLSLTK